MSDPSSGGSPEVHDEAGAGTYELLRARLLGHAKTLAERSDALNAQRVEAFGSSKFEVAGVERIRTENNTVPRDIVAVGGDLLFGYNVFIGLKTETTVDDVFSLHHYSSANGELRFDTAPDNADDNWLHDPNFQRDFGELYTYYKDARLLQLQRREGRLLAAFQTGKSLEDIRVFRWSVNADGEVSYLDNRGERDYVRAEQFDFEWAQATREDHVDGRSPYVNIGDVVFVDPTGGDLSIRLEDNTPAGETLLTEPVDDADQSLADSLISYAVLGDLVVLSVLPYREENPRGFVVNTLTRTAVRNDSILTSCLQLPEDHGIITPSGFVLRTGEAKLFEVETAGMGFEAIRRSPNGEDVLYVFHERASGLSILLAYNLIRREASQPITAHGYSIFDDGSLIVFREDAEPTRVHPMQVWHTPFVSDEFHAKQPVGGSALQRLGNADLVRGISDSLNIARQTEEAEPSAAVYADLQNSASRVLNGYFWLSDEETGNLAEPLTEIAATSTLIIDEFEKVQNLHAAAATTLAEARAEVAALVDEIEAAPPANASEHVGALRRLRQQQGHLITLRDVRYIDLDAMDALEAEVVAAFEASSTSAASFFAGNEAFVSFHTDLESIESAFTSATRTPELDEPRAELDALGEGLDVLTQVVSGLEIDDPTVRTEILGRLSDVMAGLNRCRAIGENQRKSLATSEGAAAFSVEMTLLSQAVSGELARATTPALADEALGRLLLQLEELESRFAEFDDELVEIGHRRDEVYESLSSRKQSLLDERQRNAQRLIDAADRILGGVGRRIERFESTDELNSWFVSDPMVGKVRSLAEDLRELDQAVSADELLRRLDTAREDAGRSLRDRSDIFEEGGNVIRLGNHRFSVDTEPLELTVGVIDDELNAVLTGTDYRQPLHDEVLDGSERFWTQHLASENADVGRAMYLAGTILLDALGGTGEHTLDDLRSLQTQADGLATLARTAAEQRVDEGYERGVHDHDAALLLDALLDPISNAGLLRYDANVRADAIVFWLDGLDDGQRDAWAARCRSLGRLRSEFARSPAIADTIAELAVDVAEHGHANDPATSAEYLFEELAEDVLSFDTSADAIALADAFRLHQTAGDRTAAEIASLPDLDDRLELTEAWLTAFASAQDPDRLPVVPEAIVMIAGDDVPRDPHAPALGIDVTGLLGTHQKIDNGVLHGRADEMLTTVRRYRRDERPAFEAYQAARSKALATTRDELRLDEFQPKVMSAFVRNQLIDQSYLPMIGDNFAKQLGSLDSGRTDQMGLLLLISPPGYGKTTLMEYVANRLGMVFVKVNGPALGTGVTSLDPSEAPDATAAQEVDKINFALEMGSNVLLYLDDIQHTNPELLQKFISMTDAQRRMEGVWKGRTKTYDLRGKRFAVVMAGNPYTESGERFAIPDMLANRADTYNLGDVLSGQDDLFALSYIENAIASSPVLKPMTTRDLADVPALVEMAKRGSGTPQNLQHPYTSEELNDMVATMERLLHVQKVLLSVNMQYIASASMSDDHRTEPPFQLQGSYRNMARLAEKVLPVMNDAEIETLIDDHYAGEAQTLTSGTEANLLKLGELRGTLSDEDQERWDAIKESFARIQRRGGSDGDPMLLVAESLSEIGETLKRQPRARATETVVVQQVASAPAAAGVAPAASGGVAVAGAAGPSQSSPAKKAEPTSPVSDVQIPEVGGMRLADALQRLFEADLKVARIDGFELEDMVVSTEPPAGTAVPLHSVVEVLVGTTFFGGDDDE